jgi:N utilization substance protein A
MTVTLSDEARQYIALLDTETDVAATDCIVDESEDRIVFVVPPGTMGKAIGPGGKHVKELEARLGTDVELVEGADTPEDFVANALAPAAVYNVTISEDDTTVAYAEVDHDDRGVAIGKQGRNIAIARQLAKRHFDIDEIELT